MLAKDKELNKVVKLMQSAGLDGVIWDISNRNVSNRGFCSVWESEKMEKCSKRHVQLNAQ